jgi:putative redox protein
MVRVDVTYRGGLRCEAMHGPSGEKLITDAPVDNHGKGESFSPTDLVATGLGTCFATIMGIVAEREKAAHTCPVHQTLHGNVEMPIEFVYP